MVKSTYCPCRGPMFSSQYPYDDLQPSVTPAQCALVSVGRTQTWYRYIHAGKAPKVLALILCWLLSGSK